MTSNTKNAIQDALNLLNENELLNSLSKVEKERIEASLRNIARAAHRDMMYNFQAMPWPISA